MSRQEFDPEVAMDAYTKYVRELEPHIRTSHAWFSNPHKYNKWLAEWIDCPRLTKSKKIFANEFHEDVEETHKHLRQCDLCNCSNRIQRVDSPEFRKGNNTSV